MLGSLGYVLPHFWHARTRVAETHALDLATTCKPIGRVPGTQLSGSQIASEYRFQYPGLMSVFEVFRGRTYTLDRDELEFLCLQLSEGEHALSNDGKSWIQGQEPSYIIEALWRIGFLRAQAVGGVKTQRRSGSSYL